MCRDHTTPKGEKVEPTEMYGVNSGTGTDSDTGTDNERRPAPRGILKTAASKAAKKRAQQTTMLESLNSDVVFKVLVLGAGGCGKSTLCRTLGGQAYSPASALNKTLGIETNTVLLASYNGHAVFVQLVDVPFETIVAPASVMHLDIAFTGAHAALVLLDSRDVTETADENSAVAAVDLIRDELERRICGPLRDEQARLASEFHAAGPKPASLSLPFPMYLLAHRADSPAQNVAKAFLSKGGLGSAADGGDNDGALHSNPHGAALASKRGKEQPGFHFDFALSSRAWPEVYGVPIPRYREAWYPTGPFATSQSAAPMSKSSMGSSAAQQQLQVSPVGFRYARGLSPDELGSYARAAGYRGWWWTSCLPTLALADATPRVAAASVSRINPMARKLTGSAAATVADSDGKAAGGTKAAGSVKSAAEAAAEAKLRAKGASKAEKEAAAAELQKQQSTFNLVAGSDKVSAAGPSSGAAVVPWLDASKAGIISAATSSSAAAAPATRSSFGRRSGDSKNDLSQVDAVPPSASLQTVMTALVDDCLEFWGHTSSTDASWADMPRLKPVIAPSLRGQMAAELEEDAAGEATAPVY